MLVLITHIYIPDMKNIVTREVRLLSLSKETEHIKQDKIMSYRRQPNLRDILVHSQLSRKKVKAGTFKCGKKTCTYCKYLTISDNFQNNQSGTTYRTKGHITCDTANIIYLITCKKCKKQYVGQTSTPFRFRIAKSFVNNKKKR